MNTYISFCLILTHDMKTTTERKEKKKAKFSKPTKKMGEELAAKKRHQQNFGSSEIEYQRKLKSTLAARRPGGLENRATSQYASKGTGTADTKLL